MKESFKKTYQNKLKIQGTGDEDTQDNHYIFDAAG